MKKTIKYLIGMTIVFVCFIGFFYKSGSYTVSAISGATENFITNTNLVKQNGQWVVLENGSINKNYTGLAKNPSGAWYYVKKGVLDRSYTGAAMQPINGKHYYVKNGRLDRTFNGIAKSKDNGQWYYMEKGVHAMKKGRNYSCFIAKHSNGKWYYFHDGIMRRSFTGIGFNPDNHKAYYVRNGILDRSFSGIHYGYETPTGSGGKLYKWIVRNGTAISTNP